MAKKSKETGLPVIIALVFFVIATVGLGVFCYVLYSDQATREKAAADAKASQKKAEGAQATSDNMNKLYRVALGVDLPDDRKELLGDPQTNNDVGNELKRINESLTAKLAQLPNPDKTTPPLKDLIDWAPEADGKVTAPPKQVLLDNLVKVVAARDLARAQAKGTTGSYDKVLPGLAAAEKEYQKASKSLDDKGNEIKGKIDTDLKALQTDAAARAKKYTDAEASVRGQLEKSEDDVTKQRQKIADLEKKVETLNLQIAGMQEAREKSRPDQLTYDDPKGKVLRRLSDDTVEIDQGTNSKVRPGLTFSVLPADFPSRGYLSRVRAFRVPDERGQYHTAERFVTKASLEVIEVLGPDLSKARVVPGSEDTVRDRVLTGDLLYNVAWKPGYSEHVALFGVFDVNGDGSDDMPDVVRDLQKMGLTVDAYYDLRTLKWVGSVTERTRYAIEGYSPINGGVTDAFQKEKTALLGGLGAARDEARKKGVQVVKALEFFPKMGYKIRQDVSDDKINQATARFLQGVTVQEPTVAPAP